MKKGQEEKGSAVYCLRRECAPADASVRGGSIGRRLNSTISTMQFRVKLYACNPVPHYSALSQVEFDRRFGISFVWHTAAEIKRGVNSVGLELIERGASDYCHYHHIKRETPH
ncbi:hypothetical protein EVAR_103925_1 [Eumeta japonica]|uniref:Uncharacterized protein n=1 Tax=Eumeta variegata TaxID=151549 RepID=A0A4C1T2S2_EUMVA|nr:hypothetical protein EVAR_103925_1 [Eumeta japonica]